MIGALRGKLEKKTTEYIIVDVGGVGYQVQVPLSTYYALGEPGEGVKLQIYTHVRDDALQLYGFLEETEQRLFERLISVAGIGPKLAVTILSGMEVDTLVAALAEEDIARLATIPGVGQKTAERMALELKDKVLELAPAAVAAGPRGVREDVLSALVNLGYQRRVAERALEKVEEPSEQFEQLLRQTLRVLAGSGPAHTPRDVAP
ncbi:MAG: Holliday junction branch migration protein RuvA [Acidobacteriota bacterium]